MAGESLRVALLSYRGNPFSGGQGIYVRHLSRELVRLGHRVDVLSGQPYPHLDDGVRLVPVPSLDLYREPDPFRTPHRSEFRDLVDLLEYTTMITAGFPEPLTFSLRARKLLTNRRDRYDVVHDNQTLGYGLLGLSRWRIPLVTTIHHPVQIDRRLELDAASGWRRITLRRFYGFTRMQRRVAPRLERVLTVSAVSRHQIVEHLRVPEQHIHVVPIGIDLARFSPAPHVPRAPGRIVTIASADVPLKGLLPLVEAVAKLRAEREIELVVIGSARPGGAVATAIDEYDLQGTVRFTGRIPEAELVDQVRSAQVAVVPSLFEGFSLPLVEAMACGTPVVATTAGALPEVAGSAATLVPPGDPQALAIAIGGLLDDPVRRAALAAAGREHVVGNYSWASAATRTAEHYRAAIDVLREEGRAAC